MAVDRRLLRPQVRLVEHEWVTVQPEQVARVRVLLQRQQRGEVSLTRCRGLPFCNCAGGGVALVKVSIGDVRQKANVRELTYIVVNVAGPPGNNSYPIEAVVCDRGYQRVEAILFIPVSPPPRTLQGPPPLGIVSTYLVPQHGPRVVSHHVNDPIILPRPQHVPIMQPCDRRRDQAVRAEPCRVPREPDLREPRLVPRDLLFRVKVRRLVERLMRERVRDVVEGVPIPGRCEPGLERVAVRARPGVRVLDRGVRPEVRAGAERLLVFERRVDLLCVFDWPDAAVDALVG